MMLKTRKHAAFTLIEMVIVLFIIFLLLIIIPNINQQKQAAQSKTEADFQITLQIQVDMYEGSNPTWQKLLDEHYLSKAQYNKTTDRVYAMEDGTVTKPK